jgi:hypothetical protein
MPNVNIISITFKMRFLKQVIKHSGLPVADLAGWARQKKYCRIVFRLTGKRAQPF